MQESFENWMLAQFGSNTKVLLRMVNGEYVEENVTAMYIAFNAGAMLNK